MNLTYINLYNECLNSKLYWILKQSLPQILVADTANSRDTNLSAGFEAWERLSQFLELSCNSHCYLLAVDHRKYQYKL